MRRRQSSITRSTRRGSTLMNPAARSMTSDSKRNPPSSAAVSPKKFDLLSDREDTNLRPLSQRGSVSRGRSNPSVALQRRGQPEGTHAARRTEDAVADVDRPVDDRRAG